MTRRQRNRFLLALLVLGGVVAFYMTGAFVPVSEAIGKWLAGVLTGRR